MILPPRTLAIRLFFWTALLAYAMWIMRGKGGEEEDNAAEDPAEAPPALAAPDRRVPLPRPGPPPTAAPGGAQAPEVVDIEAAVAAMDAAATALAACGAEGKLSVRLDANGLSEAWILPAGPLSEARPLAEAMALSEATLRCASEAAWAPPWPRAAQGFEMEVGIVGPHAPVTGAGRVK
ncbi:MAG: hypothetical protein Q8P18_18640 [Pseudomonadota bacterium]|nr:hypothetical protein [Pseudomonadota bacterium]